MSISTELGALPLASLDPRKLDASFCGREYDAQLLDELPPDVDPCGERSEFHTCVYDGPFFAGPVPLAYGEVVARDGFFFADQMVHMV
ncbi:MAG: hypothetical protein JRN15_11880 [Nitrososphaerota archaeon]|nr:hypothetical protein [Nitrososphaerota archaeon]